MPFSFTGINYLVGFLLTGVLVVRFLQCWRKEKTVTTQLFFYFSLALNIYFLAAAIGGLFFAKDLMVLRAIILISTFCQGLAAAFMGYLFFYIKIPNISSWYGFGIISILAIGSILFTVASPPNPFLEAGRFINWDIPLLAGVFRCLVFVAGFLPMCIIFFRQSSLAKDKSVRLRSSGLGLLLLIVLMVAPFDFVLSHLLGLEAFGSDLAITTTYVSLFFVLILTQKPASPKYVTKIYDKL